MEQEIQNQNEPQTCQCSRKIWLVVLASVLITAFVVGGVVYFLMNKEKARVAEGVRAEMQDEIDELQRQLNEKQKAENIELIDMSSWEICINKEANYEFRYPSEWLITSRYREVRNDCYNPDDPRTTSFSIGDDPYRPDASFTIIITTQKDFVGTIFEGSTSLEEYYSRYTSEPSPKIKQTLIQGEQADWTQGESKLTIRFFHNETYYSIRTDINNINIVNAIMSTFSFPNQ